MNRKVHNTMLALAAAGVMLMVGLMVALPTPARATVQEVALGPLLVRVETPLGQVTPKPVQLAIDALSVAEVAADPAPAQRRHTRRARAALALPYFSFAQGLRRNRS